MNVWVTGASSGIGRALCWNLATSGHRVVATARNEQALLSLVEEFRHHQKEQGGEGVIYPLAWDVSNDTQRAQTERELSKYFNDLQLCVVCAGHCEYVDDVSDMDIELQRRVFETNYFGAIRTTKLALPLLSKQNDGGERAQLVFVSSLSTVVGFSRAEAYGSSKAALSYFANSLRIDLRHLDIDVTLVNPGFVKTPMSDANDFDMPFIVDADTAARRICKAIARRPLFYHFPKRLWWTLSLLGAIPSFWYRVIGPKLSRY